MAIHTRLRGSTDWANATYWTNGVPVLNGDVRFVNGIDSIDSGLNQSAINLSTFFMDSQFGDGTTVIGASGTPLQIDVNGSGTKIMKVAANIRALYLAGGTGGTINRFEWFPRASTAELNLSTATVPTLYLQGGTSRIADSVVLTTVIIEDGDHTVDARAANDPTVTVNGGIVRWKRDWTALTVNGGTVFLNVEAGTTCGTITQNGGTIIWQQADTGNVTVNAGTMDVSQLVRDCTRGTLDRFSRCVFKSGRNNIAALTGGTLTDPGRGPTVVNA